MLCAWGESAGTSAPGNIVALYIMSQTAKTSAFTEVLTLPDGQSNACD